MSSFVLLYILTLAGADATKSLRLPDDPHRPHMLGNPGALILADDYPSEARRAGITGSVKMALAVDAKGVPTDCQIIESSASAILDKASCAIGMGRFRFKPATNDAGEPIASVYITPVINWSQETTDAGRPYQLVGGAPTVRSLSKVYIDIGADGGVAGCRVSADSKEPKTACDSIKNGTPITGPLTGDGHPANASAPLERTFSIRATSLTGE